MKIIKYLLKGYKLVLYSATGMSISIVMSFVLDKIRNVSMIFTLFFIITALLFVIRITDDIFDYEKDKKDKKQILSKKQLITTDIIVIIFYLTMNLYYYQLFGMISVLFVFYIFIQQRIERLKIFFMILASVYYLYMNSNMNEFRSLRVLSYLGLCFVIPAIYGFYKRKGRKGQNQQQGTV